MVKINFKVNNKDTRTTQQCRDLGGPGQKPLNKQPKFLKLLILVHLKNYFIEALNKFLICFEIMG